MRVLAYSAAFQIKAMLGGLRGKSEPVRLIGGGFQLKLANKVMRNGGWVSERSGLSVTRRIWSISVSW